MKDDVEAEPLAVDGHGDNDKERTHVVLTPDLLSPESSERPDDTPLLASRGVLEIAVETLDEYVLLLCAITLQFCITSLLAGPVAEAAWNPPSSFRQSLVALFGMYEVYFPFTVFEVTHTQCTKALDAHISTAHVNSLPSFLAATRGRLGDQGCSIDSAQKTGAFTRVGFAAWLVRFLQAAFVAHSVACLHIACPTSLQFVPLARCSALCSVLRPVAETAWHPVQYVS